MLKATEQYYKLSRAIILSIALHCVLIAVLIWSSIYQPQKFDVGGGWSSINAVMVTPAAVVQQYNHNRQQQTDAQRARLQRDKQALQQIEELQQKQAAERQHLKALEKQRLAAQEVAEEQRRDQAEQKRAKDAAKQQAAAVAKKQAETEAKKVAATDAAKVKADQAAKDKATAQVGKQSSDVDALLGILINARNTSKVGGAPVGAGKAKQSGADGAEIDAYKVQISRAISNKFYDSSSYSGRTCDLRIKLAPNGLLISVTAVGGDPALCQAAVSAAKLATIPRPPSLQVYEVFKNATLGFSPQ